MYCASNYSRHYESCMTHTCLECNKILSGKKKFCNSSCSALYNNRTSEKLKNCKRGPHLKNSIEYVCIECKNIIKNRGKKYCSQECCREHQYKIRIKNWKSELIPGYTGKDYTLLKFIRRYMFEKYDNKCSRCGWSEINSTSGNIPLSIHHIDGDARNSKEHNLDLLCPNCHSLTENYGSLNKDSVRIRNKEFNKKRW